MTPQDRLIEILQDYGMPHCLQGGEFCRECNKKQSHLAVAILREFVHKDDVEVDEIELANEILAHSYHDTEEADKLAHALAASKSRWL